MATPELLVDRAGPVLTVTFNRPRQRNAMTWAMYDGLHEVCDQADQDEGVRVLVLRGAGGKAFVAGTDITQFAEFSSGEDGLDYEARIERYVNRLESVSVPTVAALTGACVGGGLAIAAACDLRIATPSTRLGVPIARTLGNCISMNTCSLLVHHLGPARTTDLLLRARLLTGEEALAAGFVAELCAEDALQDTVAQVVETLVAHAPLSMWASKATMRRLRRAHLPDGDDIVRRVFGSEDFHRGVQAFLAGEAATWKGC